MVLPNRRLVRRSVPCFGRSNSGLRRLLSESIGDGLLVFGLERDRVQAGGDDIAAVIFDRNGDSEDRSIPSAQNRNLFSIESTADFELAKVGVAAKCGHVGSSLKG